MNSRVMELEKTVKHQRDYIEALEERIDKLEDRIDKLVSNITNPCYSSTR